MNTHQIFYDSSGRRRHWLTGAGIVATGLVAVVAVYFISSLLHFPLLPTMSGSSGGRGMEGRSPCPLNDRKIAASRARALLHRDQQALLREIAASRRPSFRRPSPISPEGSAQIVAAFYAPWQETGLHSLRANADRLTHVIPEWLHLTRDGAAIDSIDWDPRITPHNLDVVNIAREHHVAVHPILNNAEDGAFDPARAHLLLASPDRQASLAHGLRDWLVREGFEGLNVDLENLDDKDYKKYPEFLRLLADTLHAAGLSISTDLEASHHGEFFREMAAICDFTVLMAYDEHYEGGEPGPIASIPWFNRVLDQALRDIPQEKLVVGIGNYSYDWLDGTDSTESISYQTALMLAEDNYPDEPPAKVVDFDPDALNSTFEYTDENDRRHEVWMLDAVSAYNQCLLARGKAVRGSALWALGSEDPSIWTFMDRRNGGTLPAPGILAKVQFPYEVEFDGEGEILSVVSTPQPGSRAITVDSANGLCTDMEYQAFPSSYMVQRRGYVPKKLALTFDDGPDDQYTPQILDELRDLHVPGTFFVIGENAVASPDIIKRIWAEGHEIGSHTFTHPNMGEISERRKMLEMNTTQRAIQSILGRSTILFRPPYNADAEPVSGEEIAPVAYASKLGYLTIGELIDPQDWNLWKADSNGNHRERTIQELIDEIIRDVHEVKGNMVLLHDAGGDRSQTVAALRVVVPMLRKEGYQFVRVSDLMGTTRDAVMPVLQAKDIPYVGFDRFVFRLLSAQTILALLFTIAIVLGIGRVLFVISLSLLGKRGKGMGKGSAREGYEPPVSVLIAAYNERPVIARTIESVLGGSYGKIEVIVVDDGSHDGTAEEVERAFGVDPRVTLIRQANGGKASALNTGIARASGEILVCIDADTQFAHDAIALLVRHFADPAVGAVAGNVKVGNRINIFTRWQSIEYITSQNIDRIAYAHLNAVTVVPGAVGAWRREAVIEAGGYLTDTLAEDMDLTWRVRRAGWRILTENEARAYTEAPDTLAAFFKQRFRWAFGTLQCLWKHRDALFRYGWFGRLALPVLWLFQIVFQVLAPLVDIQMFYALVAFIVSWAGSAVLKQDWQPLPETTHMLEQTAFFYLLFFVVDLAGALIAFRLDRERPKLLWLLFFQRFVYRQLMYAVIWKSIWTALRGMRQRWGKLQRKGTVEVAEVEVVGRSS
jgi:cellulose synthase/poly-beta-1,6-N-acetylglucosamine synthase-like glycosyltransferase/spore germination protein YaaH/peptidoglycan/xylan/chitin deacetylase (PgdA/CDA1 family)